jgi:hypothetical protein
MIEEGFKIGIGIALAFGGLWVAGWVLVWVFAILNNRLGGE